MNMGYGWPTSMTSRLSHRARGVAAACLVVLTSALAGCAPEEFLPEPPSTTTVPPPTTTTTIGILVVWVEEEEPPVGDIPFTVEFRSTVKGGVPPFTYQWFFDDGSEPSTEANPTHTYTEPGRYWPEVHVKDARGEEDSDTTIVDAIDPNVPEDDQ